MATSRKEPYDVIVVGAGMAGIMAALAAKKEDNRVLIIEPSNVLGGQGTAGGVAGFCGDTQQVNDCFADLIGRLSQYGFIRDYRPNSDRRPYDLEWCAFFLQEMVLERKIDVLLHARVIDARMEDGRVTELTVSTAGGVMRFAPEFVIDASGACVVPQLTACSVVNAGANRQLPMSLYFTLWNTGNKVSPFLPPGCPKWENDEEIPMTSLHVFDSGKVEVKMKVVGFDAADGLSRSQAEIHARRHMMSLIYYLQTHGYAGRKLDTHVLASVSRSIGVREERRIVGEHVLTEEEASGGTVFDDAVAVGTYHFDYHWPDRMQRAGTGITTMVEPYHFPLRCMVPKGTRNILVPGRGASGDQMAMSSFRVMATVAQMGFGAGHAARLSVRKKCPVSELDPKELQRFIEAGGQSLNLSDYGDYLRQSLLTREYLFGNDKPFAQCHASTLVQLRNNRFLAAWFGGTREGRDDVGIWMAERFQGQWSPPRLAARIGDEPHWNPVLFLAPDNRVHLYFKAGPSARRWRTLRIISGDQGQTWSQPEALDREEPELPTGPVKNKPIILSDGTCLAPNSVETETAWNVYVDRSADGGNSWTHGPLVAKTQVEGTSGSPPEYVPPGLAKTSLTGKGAIQPTLWESEPGRVHMLVRTTAGYIFRSDSRDYGKSWAPLYSTGLPNNNSGLDLATLKDGALALVYNPVSANWGRRTPLSIALSFDNGQSWPHRLDIETAEGEYSYPSIIPTARGMAIVYTWKRERIAFWHGSIEQIAHRELIERTEEELLSGVSA